MFFCFIVFPCDNLSFIPVQTSLKNLHSDISQKFETLVAKTNSQKELISQLEEKMMKVNM